MKQTILRPLKRRGVGGGGELDGAREGGGEGWEGGEHFVLLCSSLLPSLFYPLRGGVRDGLVCVVLVGMVEEKVMLQATVSRVRRPVDSRDKIEF